MTDEQPTAWVPDLRPVTRTINSIQTTRTLLIFAVAGGTAMGVFAGEGGLFSLMALLAGVMAAMVTYVLFGWMEHTLGLLADICRNTL